MSILRDVTLGVGLLLIGAVVFVILAPFRLWARTPEHDGSAGSEREAGPPGEIKIDR